MKYEAEIDGRPFSVDLEQRDDIVVATVDGRHYELRVARTEEDAFLILSGHNTYEARVWATESNTLRVKIREHLFAANIVDRKHRRISAEHLEEGRKQLIAPMPGKVVRVLLGPGDEVRAGQGVVVVEAMKMQNEIKSPKAGHVVEVRVAEGATVTASQVLAVVE
jgi:biotin carboxyl carrier protein